MKSPKKHRLPKQSLLFAEMPDAPYASALRELTEISQGFSNDPSILLVKEHNACPEAKHWSKILSGDSTRGCSGHRRDLTQLYLPAGVAPPLI